MVGWAKEASVAASFFKWLFPGDFCSFPGAMMNYCYCFSVFCFFFPFLELFLVRPASEGRNLLLFLLPVSTHAKYHSSR